MIRPQYHFRRQHGHVLIWNVARLAALSLDLPVIRLKLAEIRELDEAYWYDATDGTPTCRDIARHMAQVGRADPGYPILLCAEGRVMDGMHRVVKALIAGAPDIAARRLDPTPPPDFIDIPPDALPYDPT